MTRQIGTRILALSLALFAIVCVIALGQFFLPTFAYGSTSSSGSSDEPLLFYIIGGVAALAVAFYIGIPGLIKDVSKWWKSRH